MAIFDGCQGVSVACDPVVKLDDVIVKVPGEVGLVQVQGVGLV